MTKTLKLRNPVIWKEQVYWILIFGHWNLPFDWVQGGELVEPFDIWYL